MPGKKIGFRLTVGVVITVLLAIGIFAWFNIESQSLKFFHHNVERFRKSWLKYVLTFHDGLVHASSSSNVI